MSYIGNEKIAKMYLGDTGIAKAYLGDDLVFQSGGASNRIPYIRGGADGSYIDTGITPDQTTKVIVWARNWNPGGDTYTWFFGSRVANLDSMFGVALMSSVNLGKIRLSYGNTNTDIDSGTWALMSHYHKYEFGPDGFYVDDTLISTVTAETFSNDLNIYLFGLNGSTATPLVPMDICACKIYKGGNLVRDYTAVRYPSVGLKDDVSGTVFTNAGSGSFTFGRFDPNAYTPLKTILTEGSSYFSTGVRGTYSVPIVMRCLSILSSAIWSTPIGCRDTSSKWCEFTFGNDDQRNARLYGRLGTSSAGAIYNSNTVGYYDNKYVTLFKKNNSFKAYYNYTELGSGYTGTTDTTFDTGYFLYIGARRNAAKEAGADQYFGGRLVYARVGDKNYVPALVNNVAGMYDTYNDVFKASETSTPFTAGTPINE